MSYDELEKLADEDKKPSKSNEIRRMEEIDGKTHINGSLADGPYIGYTEDRKRQIVNYSDGLLHGSNFIFDYNGKLESKKLYKNGELDFIVYEDDYVSKSVDFITTNGSYYKTHLSIGGNKIPIDCRDIIKAYELDWDLGNILKYTLRYGKKDEDKKKVLEKIIHYATMKLEDEKKP